MSATEAASRSGHLLRIRRRPRLGAFYRWIPKLVLSPTLATTVLFVYVFIVWTGYLSFTTSRMLPDYHWAGLLQYERLWTTPRWYVAVENLALFSLFYIGIAACVGLLLAILLDQNIRAEGALRTIYLYPMAISFIVTGTAWKWIMDPSLGVQKLAHDAGLGWFRFDWIIDPRMAVYTLVIAAVWQSSGFAMAVFLAGLRGVNDEVIKAATLDGATLPKIYWRIIIPALRPSIVTVVILLSHLSIKSYDLVVALTNGGPGYATELPSTFMYSSAFSRNQLGVGAASAVMMMMTIAAIIVPYLYSELSRGRQHA